MNAMKEKVTSTPSRLTASPGRPATSDWTAWSWPSPRGPSTASWAPTAAARPPQSASFSVWPNLPGAPSGSSAIPCPRPCPPSWPARATCPSGVLGPCAFVARYGHPGNSVRAWIRNGAGSLAGTVQPAPARTDGTPNPSATQLGPNALEQACIAGDTRACTLAVVGNGPSLSYGLVRWGDDSDTPRDLILYDHDWPGWAFGGPGAHLLADMAAEVGPDRFAAFWRTDRPVEAALAGIGLLLGAKGRPLTGL